MDKDLLAKAKSLGFSDRQIAHLTQRTASEVRAERNALGLMPGFRLVDTCAAEFEAYTPYYYSSYDQGDDEGRRYSPQDAAEGNALHQLARHLHEKQARLVDELLHVRG